jgi:hypothetical protein
MILLLKEVKLLKRSWMYLMIRHFKSTMRDLYRSVIIARERLIKKLLLDIKKFAQKTDH